MLTSLPHGGAKGACGDQPSSGRRPARARIGVRALALVSMLLCGATALSAQGNRLDVATRGNATRGDLEALAERVIARVGMSEKRDESARVEAERILRRLREGDLSVGDRIVLRVPGVAALSDTFTVRAGRLLEMPSIPPVPLAGVLRSELEHHMRLHLARFVRDTSVVHVRSLMRVAVVGEVNRPGYYAVAPDALVGDVLMDAGGLTRTADAEKMLVRRGSEEVWPRERLRAAVIEGLTLDELNLRAGDEIVVGARRNWGEYVRTAALAGGVIVSLLIARQ